jgi:catalase (peroxidase I)
MLTTDLALKEDPAYIELAQLYASDMDAFGHDFMHAWYKLTTRDMGPHSRCIGPLVPPPQPWQYPLPDPPAMLPDFPLVKVEVEALIAGDPPARNALIRLAWRCAATFRSAFKSQHIGPGRIRPAT